MAVFLNLTWFLLYSSNKSCRTYCTHREDKRCKLTQGLLPLECDPLPVVLILQSTAKQLFQFLIYICLVAGSYSSLHGECGWLPQWVAIRARELRKQCLNYSQIRRYPHDHYYDFKCMHPEGWQLSKNRLYSEAETFQDNTRTQLNYCSNAQKELLLCEF